MADQMPYQQSQKYIAELLLQNDIVSAIERNLPQLLSLIPELESMIGFDHCHPHHHLDVWNHTLMALSLSENDFAIRLAILLHDIGKPHCFSQEGNVRHYQGHAEQSALMVHDILKRFAFDKSFIYHICQIIKKHDTPLAEEDLLKDLEFAKTLFEVQRCDALAHNPQYNKNRLEYLNRMRELFKRQDASCAD